MVEMVSERKQRGVSRALRGSVNFILVVLSLEQQLWLAD